MKIFLVAGILGFMSGVLGRSFLFAEWWYVPTLVGLSLIGTYLLRVRSYGALVCVGVVLFSYGCGAFRMHAAQETYDLRIAHVAHLEEKKISFTGIVFRDPERRDTGTVLYVRPQETDLKIRVSVSGTPQIAYGDVVSVEGVLKKPDAFETDLGRTFNYLEYLRAQDVTHTISIAKVERIREGEGSVLLARLFLLKHRFAESIRMMLPEPQASFALGLLLGEKQGLGEELEDAFRTVGIIHIVVLSGYNLTIIAEALMRLLSRFTRPRMRAIVGGLAILAFACAVGPSATVVRATIMALLVLYARATGRTYDALRALLIAGLGMVLLNPYTLGFDPGFQFSFLATLGLILVGPAIDRLLQVVPSYAGLREYVTSTTATQLAVTPLLLWSIGTVSVIALVANTLILIAVPLAMLLSFVAGIIGLIFPGFILAAYPAYLVLAYILKTAMLLAAVPFASFSVPPFSFVYVFLVYALFAGFYLYGVYRRRKTERPASLRIPRGARSLE